MNESLLDIPLKIATQIILHASDHSRLTNKNGYAPVPFNIVKQIGSKVRIPCNVRFKKTTTV